MSEKTGKTRAGSAKAVKAETLAVPQSGDLRDKIAQMAETVAREEDITSASGPEVLLKASEKLLSAANAAEDYKSYAAIMLANAANAKNFAQVPFERRMLMLPRCLAIVPEVSILKQHAKQLGYEILHADGTPAVLRVLAAGKIDAICGVACMDSLRRVFDTVRRLGAPAIAVPLNVCGCESTQTDLCMLKKYLDLHSDQMSVKPNAGYLGVLQQTSRIFQMEKLTQLLQSAEITPSGDFDNPVHAPAVDFLTQDGKRLRPFITLAAAAATSGKDCDKLGDKIFMAAAAIEAFHKASLVHDDIEDADATRYGKPTMHAAFGTAAAINIGDYMLGIGYKLISAASGKLTAQATAIMADAHCKLALGQGAELFMRDENSAKTDKKSILRSYALKTSPAFEAALRLGMLLGSEAEPDEKTDRAITLFCRHLGVGFQLLNDLNDFSDDKSASRITFPILLAGEKPTANALAKSRRQTSEHVNALKQRALEISSELQPEKLAQLCVFLAELVLDNNGET